MILAFFKFCSHILIYIHFCLWPLDRIIPRHRCRTCIENNLDALVVFKSCSLRKVFVELHISLSYIILKVHPALDIRLGWCQKSLLVRLLNGKLHLIIWRWLIRSYQRAARYKGREPPLLERHGRGGVQELVVKTEVLVIKCGNILVGKLMLQVAMVRRVCSHGLDERVSGWLIYLLVSFLLHWVSVSQTSCRRVAQHLFYLLLEVGIVLWLFDVVAIVF